MYRFGCKSRKVYIGKGSRFMESIYYVGFYNGEKCKFRKNCNRNIAGSMKMDFIISSLKKKGYRVILLSLSLGETSGYVKEERIVIDEQEEHIYLPYFSIRMGNRNVGAGRSAIASLYSFGVKNFKRNDKVIVYHSMAYGNVFKKLQRRCGIKLIAQIEELYSLSVLEQQDVGRLKREEKMFVHADGFLFVNDLLIDRYAKNKPYAVSYGNYKVFADKNVTIGDEEVGLVYTGIINDDRGIFRIIEAMEYLPQKYTLHVLGFGSKSNMRRFEETIQQFNCKQGIERIFFYGTKTGEEYTEFLSNYHVGISLMDTSEEVGTNAFPSKIMAYLGHSLLVVSSRCDCIVKSKVASQLYFCDNSPRDIAETIKSIPLGTHTSPCIFLQELEKEFAQSLDNVLKTV